MSDAKITLKVLAVLLLLCAPVAAQELIPLVPSPPLLQVAPAPVLWLTPTTVTSTSTDWSGGGTTVRTKTIYPNFNGWTQTETTMVLDGADSTFDWGTTTHVTVTPTWGLRPVVWVAP